MQRQWKELIFWDGILPLAVAMIPSAIVWNFPRNDIAEVAAVVLVPIAAALVRTMYGYRQLHDEDPVVLTVGRQIALAAAIIFLMLFEGMAAILTIAKDAPRSAWLCPLALFVCYLIAIGIAFRSNATMNPITPDWRLHR